MFTDAKLDDQAHQSSALQPHGHRILRLSEVMHLTGYRRASLYAKTNRHSRQFDPTFPQRISLSASGRGAVGWLESEVLAWLQLRIKARAQNVKASSKHVAATLHLYQSE